MTDQPGCPCSICEESGENLSCSLDAESILRDRIVAAIAKADQDWCSDNPLYEDMADAVIRELGLKRVRDRIAAQSVRSPEINANERNLRNRIAAVIADALAVEASIAGEFCNRYVAVDDDGDQQGDELLRLDCSVNPRHVADSVIAALGTRQCERCRHPKPLTDFPEPHEGSDQMRPFCLNCTAYVEWATS